MPFDYFNTSHLAFGSKLTKAFRQLESYCSDVEDKFDDYLDNIDFYKQYINRNYRVPFPSSPDSPVQVAQFLDLVNDEMTIRKMSYSNSIFTCELNYFNRSTNRFTIAAGSTNIKSGYAYLKESISNVHPVGEISFYSKEQNKGKFLFQYRIDSNNYINIVKHNDALVTFQNGNVNHITKINRGAEITLPYTASDYECVLVIGKSQGNGNSVITNVNNGQYRVGAGGKGMRKFSIVYLKPKDKLTSTIYEKAYKVIYS